MQPPNKEKEVYKKHIDKLVKPIFDRVLKEKKKNLVSVGQQKLIKKQITFYQPHNYRVYLDFSKKNFNPNPISANQYITKKRLITLVYKYSTKNYGKEHEYKNFLGCRIRIKKTQVEVTNLISHKKWYSIEIGTKEEVKNQINKITNLKDQQCKDALRYFIKLHNGSSNYDILNRMSDDKVMDSNIRKKIPKKLKFRTKIVKKLYNEPFVEYSDPVSAANYMHNMGVEDLAPEIHKDLVTIKEAVFGTLKQNESTSKLITEHISMDIKNSGDLKEFHKDIKVHNKVLKGIDKSFKRFNKLLEKQEQKKLNDWL